MIRDADKGVPSVDYDFGAVESPLRQIGGLHWEGMPVWEWARRYNYLRTSELKKKAKTVGNPSLQTLKVMD
jgi:hypothetical protein